MHEKENISEINCLVQFSHSVVSANQSMESLCCRGLQHTRLPYPSLTPGVCSDSCLLSRWCHPSISSLCLNCAVLTHVRLFVTPWIVVHQGPLSLGILQARIWEWVAMHSTTFYLYCLFNRIPWTNICKYIKHFMTCIKHHIQDFNINK